MEIISDLEENEVKRYSRQFILPQIEPQGQIKLKNSRILIVGLGGLGSPVLMYLVSAGVGTIGIVDHDIVEIHNLQRQVIHNENYLGKSKVESAANFAKLLNNDTNLVAYNTRLTSQNAKDIMSGFHLVLDCSDNVAVRYVINDYAKILKIDFIAASVLKWEGQVFVFNKEGPCYRCMFPEPNERISSCDEAGIIGPACGVIGSIQAIEAMKLIIGKSDPMLIIFNLFNNEYKKFNIQKKVSCQVCVNGKHIPLASKNKEKSVQKETSIKFINWSEYLKNSDNFVLVDVRSKSMYAVAHFKNAINIPINNIEEYVKKHKFDRSLALLCRKGISACKAAEYFQACGICVVVIQGGIEEYKQAYNVDFLLI